MRYIFSTEAQYGYLSMLTQDTKKEVPRIPFGEMISLYVKMCIEEWYFGYDVNDSIYDFQHTLHRYLTVDEALNYTVFLHTTLWTYIDNNIDDDITSRDDIEVKVDDYLNLTIDVIPQHSSKNINPLSTVIDNICIEVEQQLYSGEYVHPRLMEIYDARRYSGPT